MPRTARVTLSIQTLDKLRTDGSITINIPPDVDTLRIEVTKTNTKLEDLLQQILGRF